jgi:hypothetical protein
MDMQAVTKAVRMPLDLSYSPPLFRFLPHVRSVTRISRRVRLCLVMRIHHRPHPRTSSRLGRKSEKGPAAVGNVCTHGVI